MVGSIVGPTKRQPGKRPTGWQRGYFQGSINGCASKHLSHCLLTFTWQADHPGRIQYVFGVAQIEKKRQKAMASNSGKEVTYWSAIYVSVVLHIRVASFAGHHNMSTISSLTTPSLRG
ncbi:hypothetical protein K470DRAFT_148928 [Piedraia hortae CBS 480.64]|uniref:Uncharacterized protein n=1 Tax=Piedraia hortae CBS 480.64 TaxID=1314780 RepID=A0A6A7BRS7_9PEZI|nr:hypothetical protein K470DRAFT_148928 [Piedraia hortae CBS 480.64]